MTLLSFIAAFLGGTALAYLGYRLANWFLKRREQQYPLVSVIRQTLNVAYLIALFLIGRHTAANLYALLIGGALGLTIPAFILTARLVRKTELGKSDQPTDSLSQENQTERRDDNG